MGFSHLASFAPHFSIYPFCDGLVLHRDGSQRLWALNQSAATIWCLLPEAENEETLAREYAERFRISISQAMIDTSVVMERLEKRGVFAEEDPGEELSDDPYPQDGPPVELPDVDSCRVQVGRCRIDVFCAAADFLREFSEVFPATCSDRNADLQLAILENTLFGEGFAIARNGRLVVAGLPAYEVLPHLVTLSFLAVCAAHGDDFLLHAAVLEKNGRQLLLPGNTGSGKSTLAARLKADSWTCCSDELACLELATGKLTGLPLPHVLKSGSVEPLKDHLPGLAERSLYRRMDGQLARYMQTQTTTTVVTDAPTLIFPSYQPDATAEMNRMTPAETLEGLATVGSSERPLTSEDVQALILLAEKGGGYGLVFGDLKEAVGKIDDC